MYIQQIYTKCLAQAAYYIESNGEAALVDPLRNPEPYLQMARERGAAIKYVLETHFHADFVSGHIDLAEKTGATIVFGPGATPAYKAYVAEDGEMLKLGNIHIEVLHTPGHTIESACYLVRDEEGKARAIFTGDTLFVGDVGRPDLQSGNLDKEELAAQLYRSLNDKIKPLADDIVIYPGHGAGSACGRNIGSESQSTIGHEKQFNYALKLDNEHEFIKAVTSDQPLIPGYFFKDAKINKQGSAQYDEVYKSGMKSLPVDAFKDAMKHGVVVLDTRPPLDFAAGFIRGSINIGLGGDFAVWAGTLIDPAAKLLIVAVPGQEAEAVERLARIGYDHVQGYLQGGIHSWFAAHEVYDNIPTFDSHEIKALLDEEQYNLLDVRNRKEVAKERIAGALHIPLNLLGDKYDTLGTDNKWLIYCAGGYRSMIAASFLKSRGFHFVANVEGGINNVMERSPELIETGQETE